MNDYKENLDKLYLQELWASGCPPENKMQFLGGYIFNFITYDNSVDQLLAEKMVEVIKAILNETTFEYQETWDNYINYLTMVNMPFLKDKLEWGMSIRGAWFDTVRLTPNQAHQITYDWSMPKEEITEFMRQMIEWVEEE